MTSEHDLDRRVRDANRRVFESKDFDQYDENASIFEPSRQREIEKTLDSLGGKRVLDLGCGTGNVLRLAAGRFDSCFGVDLSISLLAELRRRNEKFGLAGSEGAWLPFRDGSFDLVTMYGVMHHIIQHEPVLREVARVLRPGGCVYMDHDPNYYFGRFYHLYYRLRHRNRPGFGSEDAECSEWHHTATGGLNPDGLAETLKRSGFGEVAVHYRITTNPALSLPFRVVRALMRAVARVWKFKSLHTHFWITARKL